MICAILKNNDRVITGPAKKSRVISEKERNIVAHHEAGHTIIGMVLDEAEIVQGNNCPSWTTGVMQ